MLISRRASLSLRTIALLYLAVLLLLNLFVAILGGATAVFCILKIALIGGAV